MREYEVEVNAAQAKNLAMNIAADDTSVIWLVKLIDTAFDNVIRQVGAFDRLNNALSQRGYSLNILPVKDRPAKACRPVPDDKETIGARIKRLRIAKNWSQTELADRLNWTQGTVSMFERSRQTPTTDGLSQLADVFGTSIAALAGVQTDNTPMTEKTYLERKHPVVARGAVKPSKQPAISRRFQEQDEDDDLPDARKLGSKKYEPVDVTGPQVLAIIQFNSISLETLRDSFEVTPEEYERIREQHWNDFGARWMHELLTDLTSTYKKDKQREALAADDKHLRPKRLLKPAQMIRSQLVEELNQHFTTHAWLTKEELVANFEMGEDEYDWIVSFNYTKLGVTELRMYLTDIRGAIAERAIEVPTPVQPAELPSLKSLGKQATSLIKAFELTFDLLRPFEISKTEYDQLKSSYYNDFTQAQLSKLLTGMQLLVLQPSPEPDEYIVERLLIDVIWLEDLFAITPEIYAKAKVCETEQKWIKDRNVANFSGRELTKIREDVKTVLLAMYKEAK